jgi:hypothetical protein
MLRRTVSLHTPQPRQAAKGFVVEPLLGALAAKVQHQQFDLALQRLRRLGEKVGSQNLGLALSLTGPLKDIPMNLEVDTARNAQSRCADADLDVVGMGTK